MSMLTLMNTTCNVETETQTVNSSNMVKRSWSVTTTALPCRHQDMNETVMIEYGRLGYSASDFFYFASDPGIAGGEATKRIVWGGYAYYVQQVQNMGGQVNKVYKVVAERKPLAYSTTG